MSKHITIIHTRVFQIRPIWKKRKRTLLCPFAVEIMNAFVGDYFLRYGIRTGEQKEIAIWQNTRSIDNGTISALQSLCANMDRPPCLLAADCPPSTKIRNVCPVAMAAIRSKAKPTTPFCYAANYRWTRQAECSRCLHVLRKLHASGRMPPVLVGRLNELSSLLLQLLLHRQHCQLEWSIS